VLGEASGLRIGQFHPDDRTMPHIHDMTIIGELPSSIQGGLGGAILNFNQPGVGQFVKRARFGEQLGSNRAAVPA